MIDVYDRLKDYGWKRSQVGDEGCASEEDTPPLRKGPPLGVGEVFQLCRSVQSCIFRAFSYEYNKRHGGIVGAQLGAVAQEGG